MAAKPILLLVGMGPVVGRGIAERFGRENYRIAMISRNADNLRRFEVELAAKGIEAKGFPADASEEHALIQAITSIQSQWGMIEVAVYNAATVRRSTIHDSSSAFIADFKTNVMGAIIMTQRVAPQMKAQKKGTILFTGGGLANHPKPTLLGLGLGKSALLNLTKGLAAEYEGEGIRVGTVTIRAFVKAGTAFSPEYFGDIFYKMHRQKPGEPNEILIEQAPD